MKLFRLIPIFIIILISFSCITAADEGSSATHITDTQAAATEKHSTPPEPVMESGSPADEESDASAVIEPPAELLPPMGDSEFIGKIRELMPWNVSTVMDGSRPLAIIHDLDKNGYDDALVVAVEGDAADATMEELSKSARLFLSGQEYSNFLLLIFYQYSGEVILRYTVPVSKQLVFNGVEPFEIKKGSDFPYSLLFSFKTRSGIEQELVILSGYGITHFSIMENLSEITIIEDIDEDGYEDIIVHEQGFEEGTGFETFMTWYKWNLREYTEYKSTNIVRNLREFFLVCAEYLRAGENEAFLDYALDSECLSELKLQGLSDAEILSLIFTPAGGQNSDDVWFEEEGFSVVVFPELMETPFSYAKRNDFRHQVSVRMGRHGEQSRIFLAELRMNKNPFGEKQFCFCIEGADEE